MINNTFCHLPRIGLTTEQTLWKQGIHTWNDFITANDVPRISKTKKPWFDKQLKQANKALIEGNSTFFTNIPSTETWRLWNEYKEETAYIDIETNYRNNITVLGISDGNKTWQFVRHHNLEPNTIKELLQQFKLLVTFNGSSFDLPIIRRYFHNILPEVPHLDLRHAAAKIGLTGGLKKIEETIGINRSENTDGVTGGDALTLWSAYRNTGHKEFLDLLLEYNAEDILNLHPLANHIYHELARTTKKSLKTTNP